MLMRAETAQRVDAHGGAEAGAVRGGDTLGAAAGHPSGPDVASAAEAERRRELQLLRGRAASERVSPTTLPATQPVGGMGPALGRELIKRDVQLAAAIELLKNSEMIHATLKACAEARKKRPTTQPTGRSPATRP